MLFLTCLLLVPAQIKTLDSADFPSALQKRAVTATVRITHVAKKTTGSGVVIGKKGPFIYILTAHHVVKDADELAIAVFSEKSYPKPAQINRTGRVVAKSGDTRDLALIRMVAEENPPGILPLGSGANLSSTESFSALSTGCAKGEAPTCLMNKITGRKKISYRAGGKTAYFWETNESVNRGRSGGPLIDSRGSVIGICSGTNDGKGYFCHPEEIHRFLKQNVFDWLE